MSLCTQFVAHILWGWIRIGGGGINTEGWGNFHTHTPTHTHARTHTHTHTPHAYKHMRFTVRSRVPLVLRQIHSASFTYYIRMRAHMVTNLYRCILVYKHVTYTLIAYNPNSHKSYAGNIPCLKFFPKRKRKFLPTVATFIMSYIIYVFLFYESLLCSNSEEGKKCKEVGRKLHYRLVYCVEFT